MPPRHLVVLGLTAFVLGACTITGTAIPVVVLTPRPLASPTPCPSGGCVDASATASAGATVAASPVPSPTVAPRETGNGLDVAIAGPGTFMLAGRVPLTDLAEVYFTRTGSFRWIYHGADPSAPGPAHPTYRLETPDGLPVLGYTLASEDDTRLPTEGSGGSLDALTLDGGRAPLAPLSFDAVANPAAAARFDYRGRVLLDGTAQDQVLDADGRAWSLYVAVAQPEDVGTLVPLTGAWWRYDAGRIDAGLAGCPQAPGELPRPVGEANVLKPGWLEDR